MLKEHDDIPPGNPKSEPRNPDKEEEALRLSWNKIQNRMKKKVDNGGAWWCLLALPASKVELRCVRWLQARWHHSPKSLQQRQWWEGPMEVFCCRDNLPASLHSRPSPLQPRGCLPAPGCNGARTWAWKSRRRTCRHFLLKLATTWPLLNLPIWLLSPLPLALDSPSLLQLVLLIWVSARLNHSLSHSSLDSLELLGSCKVLSN